MNTNVFYPREGENIVLNKCVLRELPWGRAVIFLEFFLPLDIKPHGFRTDILNWMLCIAEPVVKFKTVSHGHVTDLLSYLQRCGAEATDSSKRRGNKLKSLSKTSS